MSPIEISEANDPVGTDASPCGRRASLKGFLSVSLRKYLELLDWTGRLIRGGKRGAIPDGLAPILVRLGIQSDQWKSLISGFGQLFKRVAGNAVSINQEAARRGRGRQPDRQPEDGSRSRCGCNRQDQ